MLVFYFTDLSLKCFYFKLIVFLLDFFCKYIILWNVSVEQIGAMCVWVCVWDWFEGNIAADGQRHVRMQRFR